MPAYGIHFADHTSLNRSDLGFDHDDQVYGVEVSRTTDQSLLQISVSPGRAESIVKDDGGTSFNTTGRLQVDLASNVVVVGSDSIVTNRCWSRATGPPEVPSASRRGDV